MFSLSAPFSSEDFSDDERNPWRKRSKGQKKSMKKKRYVPEPERVSSRLSKQTRVTYSDDPYAGNIIKISVETLSAEKASLFQMKSRNTRKRKESKGVGTPNGVANHPNLSLCVQFSV